MQMDQLQRVLAAGVKNRGRKKQNGMSDLMALHLDFVAKPSSGPEWMNELAEVIENARLDKEGLQVSMMLVSDREARLVTLLTFWDRRNFLVTREYCIAWMQKLLARFADGPIRAHSSDPHVLVAERSASAPVRMPVGDEKQFTEVAAD